MVLRQITLADRNGNGANDPHDDPILSREWLVTNGLGGYASGTVSGSITRRFHGLLIAALPAPHGRVMMLNHLAESVQVQDKTLDLDAQERPSETGAASGRARLLEFRLEDGLPRWRYDLGGGMLLEKSLMMPHRQNTTRLTFSLVEGDAILRVDLEPWLHFRQHEGSLELPLNEDYAVKETENRYEISAEKTDWPVLRMSVHGNGSAFCIKSRRIRDVSFKIEASRGYDATGDMFSPGYLRCELSRGQSATITVSAEPWSVIEAMTLEQALQAERGRRRRLLGWAAPPLRGPDTADLVLAADQFLIEPPGRVESKTWTRASGDESRTVIAGYHWFTDWGRDTMISLEGLTLVTGRHAEARDILGTFARYVRDGLIPNLFPEGSSSGLYHTADATLWFFHAIDRYVAHTGDRALLEHLLPTLVSIADHHRAGTRFGIGVDPLDGLITQGAPNLPLTWMDAKVGDLVVTPRRGKAVELNALYFNALRLLAGWVGSLGGSTQAKEYLDEAELARASFNSRFWYEEGGYLYDVVDGEAGDDRAMRPNQLLAISLTNPVLDPRHWEAVVSKAQAELVTPCGLRSLGPNEPNYQPYYFGDLRSRDLAYHQGTVWAWLIGPFVDAWLKVHPGEASSACRFLDGFALHLNEACIGSISEIFDANAPYTPRGCIAQAWSVAEVIRLRAKLGALQSPRPHGCL
jgi:predicted glycogen debranching enzyme